MINQNKMRDIERKENKRRIISRFEELLLEWSVAVVGQSWNIIADILRIYPLTTGYLKEGIRVQDIFFEIQERKGKVFPKQQIQHNLLRVEPSENDSLPILGRLKPIILTNRMIHGSSSHHFFYSKEGEISIRRKEERFRVGGKRKLNELTFNFNRNKRMFESKTNPFLEPIKENSCYPSKFSSPLMFIIKNYGNEYF